ncbi:S8 family serine peptidase [Candidatus Woesearchaeota archaeon]|nr:S8 family serine peptidase [Candidatus Woesearchaeota archaeon]
MKAKKGAGIVLIAAAVIATILLLPGIYSAETLTGNINVESSPPGAAVYVDSAYKGLSPVNITGQSPGNHRVWISKAGYPDSAHNVSVIAGITSYLYVNLDPTAAPPTGADLVIGDISFSDPAPSAIVYETVNITVKNIGTGPSGSSNVRFSGDMSSWGLGFDGIAPGESQTRDMQRLLNPGGYYFTAEVDDIKWVNESDETNNIMTKHIYVGSPANTGRLSISSNVAADVYVDFALVGTTPLTLDGLSPRKHIVELKKQGYMESFGVEVVVPGSTIPVLRNLEPISSTPGIDLAIIDVFEILKSEGAPPFSRPINEYEMKSTFWFAIQNKGSQTANEPIVTNFTILDTTYRFGVSSLLPGQVEMGYSGPSSDTGQSITGGTFTVTAYADPDQWQAEFDETNNALTRNLTIGAPYSPPPSTPSSVCGNGNCESGENASSCFTDCKTSSNASSCSSIAPMPEPGYPNATAQQMQIQEYTGQIPDDFGISKSFYAPETNLSKQLFEGYILQFREEPVAAIDSKMEAQVAVEEMKAQSLKREIDEVDTKGFSIIPGTIKKLTLRRQLNSRETNISALNASKAYAVSQHKSKISNEHAAFRQEMKRRFLNGESKIKAEYDTAFNGALIDVSAEEAESLRNMPGVKDVYTNNIISAELSTSTRYVKADSVWKLNDTSGNKITGRGITIAVIDTGVDYTHPDLGGCLGQQCKVIGGFDFQNNDPDPMDDHGHGTHVAATAAGKGALNGVAPDAKIYAYKVCSSTGSCSYSNIIAAINKALDPNSDGDLSDHADVITISLGGGGNPNDAASQAVDNAFDKGAFLSIAAGNSGPNEKTINCPGCARKATTVAAWCRPENIMAGYCSSPIASFSSRGPVQWSGETIDKPDIAAPGVGICAAEWDSAWSGSRCIDNSHVSISGTSMATPHVAGAAALVKQAHPAWSPQQIKDALMKTAVDQGADKYSQGTGLLDVLAAVTQSETFPTAYIDLSGKVTGTIHVNGTAFGTGFTNYTLEFGTGASPASWSLITQSSNPVINGNLGTWNTLPLIEGTYTLRLTVRNNLGEVSNKTKAVEVNNIFISSPSPNQDIVSGKDTVKIIGTVTGSNFTSYKVEYSPWANPSALSTNGISLADNGLLQKSNGLLATWNASVAQLGTYTLLLTVSYSNGQTVSEAATVYVDPSLHSGWPRQIEPCSPGWCPTVILNPSVADVDGDGEMEVLTGVAKYDAAGYPVSYRHVFRADGTVLPGWPIMSRDHLNNGFVATDINNDGTNELIINDDSTGKIYSPTGTVLGTFYIPRNACIATADIDRNFEGKEILYSAGKQVVILHSDGTTYRTIPLLASAVWPVCPATGDVDNNGVADIATFGNSEIYLFDGLGNPFAGWPKDTGEVLSSSNSPVLGDLDGDGKLEILSGGNNGTLTVYGSDGSPFRSFPLRIKVGEAQSDPAVSDIDGDGSADIIIRSGKNVYVLNNNGVVAPGWPQSMPDYVSMVNPVIGDADGDGNKDIIVGNNAWRSNGLPVPGFPKKIKDFSLGTSSSSALGDIDGDGKLELVIGPTQFEHYIYVYDLSGSTSSASGSMAKHDSTHSGNYMMPTWQSPAQFEKYYYYTLSDSQCTVNITIKSLSGSQTLKAKHTPNTCDDSWDENVTASKGQSESIIKSGLDSGSYAVYVTGIGSYVLERSNTCLKDTTRPSIYISKLPSQPKGDLPVTAAVSDTNGLKGCQACTSTDGICDSEWTEVLDKTFSYGERQGTCSFTFPGSILQDNNYTISILAEDISLNKAQGIPQSIILDKAGPNIGQLMASAIETNSFIDVSVNITDISGVANATASIAASQTILNSNNASGLYQGRLRAPPYTGYYNLSIASWDKAGNPAATSTIVFASQPVNWSTPVRISTAQRKATAPEIATDAQTGNFAVVWEESTDSSPDIYYSYITPSAHIIDYARKLTDSVYNSRNPHVSLEQGRAHIAWEDDRDGNKEIYYSQIANGQTTVSSRRVTFNSFESKNPKVLDDGNTVHMFWIDNRDGADNLYHTQLDYSGNRLASDSKLADSVDDYAVAALSANSLSSAKLAWASGGKAHYASVAGEALHESISVGDATEVALALTSPQSYVLTASTTGIALHIISQENSSVTKTISLSSSGAMPSISVGKNSGNINVVWNEPDAKHAQVDFSGALLTAPKPIGPGAEGKIAGNDDFIVLLEKKTNDYSELSVSGTAPVESIPPLIQISRSEEAQRQTGLLAIKTDEPTYAAATYVQSGAQLNATEQELNYSHLIFLQGLQPSTTYSIEVSATDAAGNTEAELTNLTTRAQASRPALPTTFYGSVIEAEGALLGGVNVTVQWTDTDGINKSTSALTATNGSLLGHYLFNRANVNARDGSTIRITAPDAIKDAVLQAQPGSLPINVTTPIIVDKTPPSVVIESPLDGATYPSPILALNFTVNEPVTNATFVLNSNAPVTVTGKEGIAINITAKTGQNTLAVTATDRIGLVGTETITFNIDDKVPPVVRTNKVEHARNITRLTANVTEQTNSLAYCEICAGTGCSWQRAQDDFGAGSMRGTCIYQWDTTTIPDGLQPVTFRAIDESGNTGNSDTELVNIDNTIPRTTMIVAEPVPKKDSIALKWQQSSDSNFKRYAIYRSSSPAKIIANITNISQTQFTDSQVTSSSTYSYAVVVVDEAGNEAAPAFQQVMSSDTTLPVISILHPQSATYNTSKIPLQYSVSEPQSWCAYRLNGKQEIPASSPAQVNADEGNNTLTLYCNDTSQNQGNASTSFFVDTTPPLPITTTASPVQGKNQIQVSWTKSPDTDFERYNVYRSSTPFQSTTTASRISFVLDKNTAQYTDFTTASQQTYYYAVTASDKAGNENTSVIYSQATAFDTVKPSIRILSPKPQVYKSPFPKLEYAANEQLAWCAYSLNSNTPLYITGNTTIQAPEGYNTLTLYCNDTSQNQNSTTATFDMDAEVPLNIKPSVRSVSGKNSLLLSWNQSTSRDFSRFNIYRSQTPFTSLPSTKITSTTLTQYEDTGLQPESAYYYSITVSDTYGNENTTVLLASATVTDTTPPPPLTTTATPEDKALSVNVRWSKSNTPDFSSYSIYRATSPFTLTSQASRIVSINDPDTTYFTDTNLASDTTYFYAVTATDTSGNKNTSATASPARTYDFTAPGITILSPLSKVYATKQPDLSININEPANCSYTLESVNQSNMATAILGNDKIGAIMGNFGSNQWASRAYMPASGSITEIKAYLKWDGTGSNNARAMIYSEAQAATLPATVPVIVLKYFPTKPDGTLDLNQTGDWQNPSLDALRQQVNKLTQGTIAALQNGSIYKGFKDTSATPSLQYAIAMEKEYLRQIKKSTTFQPFADHIQELNDINICDWVENKGVKEVWIWMTHNSYVVPIESNMAGPYGDISNSYRQADLPVCKKTYTVYDYNYGRGIAETTENRGHQLEALFSYVDNSLWYKYVNPYGFTTGVNHCGWTHSPPNTRAQYDWRNPAEVLSDCEDWKPDGTGTAKKTSCTTWYKGTCLDDGGLQFKIWWMQNMPGLANGLSYNGLPLRNWWDFIADFDFAMAKGKNLAGYTSTFPLVASSQTNTFSTTPNWVTFGFASPVYLDKGNYWLSILGQETGIYSPCDTIPAASFLKDNAPWPDSQNPVVPSLYYTCNHSIYAAYISVNSGASATITPPAVQSTVMNGTTAKLAAEEGGNKVTVSCSDAKQNTGSSTVTFMADTTPPEKAVISTVLQYKGAIKISWQPSNSTDIGSYGIYRANSPFTSTSEAPRIATAPASATYYNDTSVASEATYYYAVTVIDANGNENTSTSPVATNSLDALPPSAVRGIAVAAIPGKAELNIAWQPNPEKDLSYYSIYRSNTPFSTALQSLLAANVTANTTAYNDKSLTSETTYYYALTAVDNSSNENKTVTTVAAATADTSPPTVNITSPLPKAYNTTSVPMQYTVSESAACRYSLNAAMPKPVEPYINATEGQNTLLIECSDSSSNTGNASVTFTVDTKHPQQVKLTAAQNPRKESVALSWIQSTATDFAEYTLYRSQKNFTATSEPGVIIILDIRQKTQLNYTDISVKSQQTYYYAITVRDAAGNTDPALSTVPVTIEDLTPPQLFVTSPESGKLYSSSSIPLQYSSNEPVSNCSYEINGKSSPITLNTTSITSRDGPNTLLLRCQDLNFNTGNTTVQFSANTEAPQPIQNLTSTWTSSGAVQLAWQASAAADLKHYAVYKSTAPFNDTRTAQQIGTSTTNSYRDTSIQSEQAYNYAATAVDLYGNENTTVASVKATVPDITPPAPIQNLTVATIPGQTSLQITWQPTTANDFDHYAIYRSSLPFSQTNPNLLVTTTTEITSTSYTDTGLENGKTYHYAATAIDKAGNENKSIITASGTTADISAPLISVQQEQSPAYGRITLKATVSDNSLKPSCQACIALVGNNCTWQTATDTFPEKAQDGTCTHQWQVPSDGETYYYTFRVNDTSDNQAEGEPRHVSTVNLNEQITYTLQLYQGWNLISFPLTPADSSVRSVMKPISDKYTRMFHYDSATESWQSHFAQESIFNPEETLTEIQPGKGYWIEMLQQTALDIKGTRVPGFSAQLQKDWNMVGYPYETPTSPEKGTESISDSYYSIFHYNATHHKWESFSSYPNIINPNTITALQPGEGYMIDMRQEATWTPERQ